MLNRTFHNPAFETPAFNVMGGGAAGVVSTGCVKFDGVNDYIVTGSMVRDPGAGAISCCAWIKTTTVATLQSIVSQLNGSGTGQSWLEITASGFLQSQLGGSATTGTIPLSANAWTFVCVTVSGTTLALYVNGRSDTSATRTSQAATGVTNIGASKTPGNYFSGCIDDIRIYNTALTAAQIQEMYENQTAAPTSGLVGHWKLDDGSGTTAVDSSGNGYNGTLTNGPTWEVQVPPRLSTNRITEDWSVLFDGVNDYVDCGDGAGARALEGTRWTISLWLKPLNDAKAFLSAMHYTAADKYMIFYHNTNKIQIGSAGSSPSGLSLWTTNACVITGVWQHITMTMEADGWHVYHNGVHQSITAIAGSNANASFTANAFTKLILSGYILNSSHALPTNSNIKDVRIYSSALAQSDITKLANGQESSATPAARWRLNEGTGTTANDSIGSNHGTLTNGPTWSGDVPPWHRSIILSSHAGVFDGVNDYVDCTRQSWLEGASQASLLVWFKRRVASAMVALGKGYATGNERYGIEIYTDGNIYLDPTASIANYGYFASNDALWHHLAMVFNGAGSGNAGRLQGYLDGVSKSLSFAGTIAAATQTLNTGSFEIGRFRFLSATEYTDGNFDEVCLYNRALEAACVADAAAGYLVTAGLVARYKLDNNANDSVGSNHGTENGGMTYTTSVPGSL